MTWQDVLIAVGFTYGYAYGFWCLYVLVMGLYRAHLNKTMSGVSQALAVPIVVVAYIVDLFANWTFAVLWFREWPRKPLELVTDRLIRYIDQPGGWRHRHAVWLCDTLLDDFDPTGSHCKSKRVRE